MATVDLSKTKWLKVWDMLRWAKPCRLRDEVMDLVSKAAGNDTGAIQNMEMPDFLREFLESRTAEESEQLWTYLDGCNIDDMIEVVAPHSTNFEEAKAEWKDNLRPHVGHKRVN
jgi:hypothetical protein